MNGISVLEGYAVFGRASRLLGGAKSGDDARRRRAKSTRRPCAPWSPARN